MSNKKSPPYKVVESMSTEELARLVKGLEQRLHPKGQSLPITQKPRTPWNSTTPKVRKNIFQRTKLRRR